MYPLLSWLLGLVFALVLETCAIARVALGGDGVSDLAIYHTALLNTISERFYFTYLHPEGCLLYQHFDPIILYMLPFYALLGNAAWPVLPISLAIAVGLVFPAVARIGRRNGLSGPASLLIPCLLLFNPIMHNIVMYDFHPVVLALPLLLWGWCFNQDGNYRAGAACWIAAILCKENVPLTVAAPGAVMAIESRPKLGLACGGRRGFSSDRLSDHAFLPGCGSRECSL